MVYVDFDGFMGKNLTEWTLGMESGAYRWRIFGYFSVLLNESER